LAGSVSAEVMTFEEEYIYQASEYDSKVSCRTLALEQAKRILLEKMGTYLKNYPGIVRPTAQTPEGGALSRKAGR
jgi:hypothetical protein